MKKAIGFYPCPDIDTAAAQVVSHAGAVLLTETIAVTGLGQALSAALGRWRPRLAVHDPAKVLLDLAVGLAVGGDCLADIALLRSQPAVFGLVASDPTVSRTIDRLARDATAVLAAIDTARAAARAQAWRLAGENAPDQGIDAGTPLIIDVDATLVTAHSDKQGAAPTFKKGFGHHPLWAFVDHGAAGTGEPLAALLRPGNAGSNTALDHIEVLDEAITQLPARYRRNLLITVDGAGATLDLVRHITDLNTAPGRRVHYSVGFDLDHRGRTAIGQLSEGDWDQVLDHRGRPRDPDDAGVTELTGLLRRSADGDRLPNWPTDMRIMCRRERPSSGAQLSLMEEADGWRYQLVATNTPTRHAQFLEARHRPHARVEDRIRTGKNTGIGHLPSHSFALNQAWCVAATIACDLLCWLRLLCLEGPLARAEPKTLRYRLLHTAARLVRGQRKRKIRIPETWPWARELEACFLTVFALPPPA